MLTICVSVKRDFFIDVLLIHSLRRRTLIRNTPILRDGYTRQVQKIVKEIANRAKITKLVTPHILRHTFATLALQKGISLASVQKALGHDRLETTAIYLNFTDAHVIEEFSNKW
ncbi:tyrosine-type recombinase/integrase [Legionella sp. 27cVA30]|uniref:tyrosine-type recombinase/integrase n=1 Tax=Legionella sp. 27cVA30 TaxID=2905657 RepID=UPI0035319AE5